MEPCDSSAKCNKTEQNKIIDKQTKENVKLKRGVMRGMFSEERREKIIEILSRSGRSRVAELSRDLNVSEVTIRQDLDALEKQGMLRRTHGGAMLYTKLSNERSFKEEEAAYRREKERIAQKAAAMVTPGDTVILDVGTTTTEVARCLKALCGLTIITNALNIGILLEESKNTVILTGGTLRAKQHSLVDPYGGFILERIRADIAFIGASGITADEGVTNVNIPEAEMKGRFVRSASRAILLCDGSKIGKVALAKVADITAFDRLVTDDSAETEEIQRIRDVGLQVEIA